MPIKSRKQILSGLVSILVSVFLVATSVYAVTTIGENVSVGGNLNVNGTISEGGTALSSKYVPYTGATNEVVLGQNLTLGDNKYLYFDDAKNNWIKYSPAHGTLFFPNL